MNKKDFRENRSQKGLKKTDYTIKFNKYVSVLYQKMTDIAYTYVPTLKSGTRKILKTDLWDSIIEKERNMLYYLQTKFEGDKIYGVDISEHLVKNVEKLYPNVICQQIDLTIGNKNFHNFDYIGDYSTLDHIEEKNLGKVFSFYNQCLKEGGICLVIYYRKSPRIKLANWLYKVFSKQSFFEKCEKIGQYFFDDCLVTKDIYDNKLTILNTYNINILASFPYSLWKFIPQKMINRFLKKESQGKLKFITSFFSSMKAVIIKK